MGLKILNHAYLNKLIKEKIYILDVLKFNCKKIITYPTKNSSLQNWFLIDKLLSCSVILLSSFFMWIKNLKWISKYLIFYWKNPSFSATEFKICTVLISSCHNKVQWNVWYNTDDVWQAAAITEAKLKMSDIPCAVLICSLMYQRYADFPIALMENWQKYLLHKKDEKVC